VIPVADFDAIVTFARRRGIWLFSDEVYRLLERDPGRRLPQAADVYERGLSLNVLSKAYGLAGLRVGWIACRDRELLERMERIKHYLSICNAAPSELLARIALRAHTTILERNRGLIAANLAHVNRFFGNYRDIFAWTEPVGGCTGYPKYLGDEGVEAFCDRLLRESGVLLLPASVYASALGPTPENHFRIGFGRADLQAGLDATARFIDQSRPG
jgi:aspartate/methionine/tyrosine aminotransferase